MIAGHFHRAGFAEGNGRGTNAHNRFIDFREHVSADHLKCLRCFFFAVLMINCARENAQFIVVTHSPILLGMPDAEILSFDSGTIHPIEYEETESFRITEKFIRDRKRFLDRLLREDD